MSKPERSKAKRTKSGRLTASSRRRSATLPDDTYPMPDKVHARVALTDLKKDTRHTPTQKAKVRSRAERILRGGKSKTRKKG